MTDHAQREFPRHPADVPIEVGPVDGACLELEAGIDVGHGGLAFLSASRFEPESTIRLRIPCVTPMFEAVARVAWCHAEGDGFHVGVQFLEARDAFRSRMVQQVCHIQKHCSERQRSGTGGPNRTESALEWIQEHAAHYPD
jgi:hypothetical protein